MNISIDSFPNAPEGWDIKAAEAMAEEGGITLSGDHWELVRALQAYYKNVEFPHLREIKDALDEKFHAHGGMKHLHRILPGGPVAQGCKLAGLKVPAGAVDKSFGSVA